MARCSLSHIRPMPLVLLAVNLLLIHHSYSFTVCTVSPHFSFDSIAIRTRLPSAKFCRATGMVLDHAVALRNLAPYAYTNVALCFPVFVLLTFAATAHVPGVNSPRRYLIIG